MSDQEALRAPASASDGKWVDTNSLKADGGWQEIADRLRELNPDDYAKMDE